MGISTSQLSTTLVLPQALSDMLANATLNPLETAGVLIATVIEKENEFIALLGIQMHWVPESAYQRREADGLSIKSDGYVPALREAEKLKAIAIWVHTHPGIDALPLPSNHDNRVDNELGPLFLDRAGGQYYGALILSPRANGIAFSGHLDDGHGAKKKLDFLWIVGDQLRLIKAIDRPTHDSSSMFDRSVRAFGGGIQETLGALHVGIVGCGGTGSSIAEQLVRLGVRHFTFSDPKTLSESNVTRVYGSNPKDVGNPKVEILARHLKSIAPESQLEPIQSMITVEATAKRFSSCDIIFGCTDDNAGRLVLSRMAVFLLIPVIDCGVLITSDADEHLLGIDGRITVVSPGQACLICRGRIDLARAATELLTPEERNTRINEGYAPALGMIEPAVITFTTMVGAAAVNELLERLIGFGPAPRPSEILIRFHEREISTNVATPRHRHYCHPDSGKFGLGMTEPFLEQTWSV